MSLTPQQHRRGALGAPKQQHGVHGPQLRCQIPISAYVVTCGHTDDGHTGGVV